MGGGSGGGGRCPGEENCSDFKKEAGATREEKEAGACTGCEMFATKPKLKTGELKNESIEDFVTGLYRLRQKRISGFSLSESLLTTMQFEALITLDYLTECAERKSAYLTRFLLEENLQLNQKILSAFFGGNKTGKK